MDELRAIHYSLYELRLKGDGDVFRKDLEAIGCRVEVMEDGLSRSTCPRAATAWTSSGPPPATGVQVRSFVKSQTSLEDLFAGVVGVD